MLSGSFGVLNTRLLVAIDSGNEACFDGDFILLVRAQGEVYDIAF